MNSENVDINKCELVRLSNRIVELTDHYQAVYILFIIYNYYSID